MTVTFNGQSESNWDYWASMRPLRHYDSGDMTSSQEAEYWTVKSGFRETTVDASDSGASNGTISIESDVTTVTEGEGVTFTLYWVDGPMNRPVTVQVRTREPNRQLPAGANPSEQFHTLTFPALALTSTFIDSRSIDQTQTVTVTTTDDSNYEPRDTVRAEVVSVSHDVKTSQSKLEHRALIRDDDRPSVTLSADATSITEGETVTFTLTRDNPTDAMTVGVLVEDPGGSLEGNYPQEAVQVPSSVAFAAGDSEMTVEITPPTTGGTRPTAS